MLNPNTVIDDLAVACLISMAVLVLAQVLVGRTRTSLWYAPTQTDKPQSTNLLASVWLAAAVSADLRIGSGRDLAAVTSGASSENLIQIAVWSFGGIYALHRMRGSSFVVGRNLLVPAIALSGWLLSSSFWSGYAPLSAVRGGQFLVLVLLFIVTSRLNPSAANTLLRQFLIQFLTVLLVLLLFGLWSEPIGGRFTWFNTHPGTTSLYLAVGLIFLIYLTCRQEVSRLLMAILFIAILAACIFTRTRGTLAALLFSLIGGLLLSSQLRRLRTVIALVLSLLLASMTWNSLISWLARGEDATKIRTLTGRTELWSDILNSDSLLVGYGYGASRLDVLKYNELGTGHNSWLELIAGAGFVAAILGSVFVFRTIRIAVQRVCVFETSLLVFLLIHGLTSESWSLPGLASVLLFFTAARVENLANSELSESAGPGSRSRMRKDHKGRVSEAHVPRAK